MWPGNDSPTSGSREEEVAGPRRANADDSIHPSRKREALHLAQGYPS